MKRPPNLQARLPNEKSAALAPGGGEIPHKISVRRVSHGDGHKHKSDGLGAKRPMSAPEIPIIEHRSRPDRNRARFILSTAIDHGVHIAVIETGRGEPSLLAWAPTAPTTDQQIACERSFKLATRRNLRALARQGLSERSGPGSFYRAPPWRRS
jgi:hypothetical protein